MGWMGWVQEDLMFLWVFVCWVSGGKDYLALWLDNLERHCRQPGVWKRNGQRESIFLAG